MESLQYLQFYGIYNFATRYLCIAMISITVYGNYGTYGNFQDVHKLEKSGSRQSKFAGHSFIYQNLCNTSGMK